MLELKQVAKVYSGGGRVVRAVDNVSLIARPGELVCITGPSGCGKTTLLLMCGGLLRPSSGTVSIKSTDPYSLHPDERSRFRGCTIGFIFQQFHLVSYLDVLQNVMAPDVPFRRPGARERAEKLIRQVGLEERMSHMPAQLSSGERQRVALARALLNEPKLILADEPTGNLDAHNAAIVLDTLRAYADGGGTVLLVTHAPGPSVRATRTLRMRDGRLADAPAA